MRQTKVLSAEALAALARPPVQWRTMVETDREQLRELVQELDSLACRAAMLSAYIAARGTESQADDQGHEKAVALANRRLYRVRKELGFSYPLSGCFSF